MFSILRFVIQRSSYFTSRFFRDQRGITTIEYGILAAGLAIIITAFVAENGPFHDALTGIFDKVLGNMNISESDSSQSSTP
jgi:pilus assembly protein Flp/PilA